MNARRFGGIVGPAVRLCGALVVWSAVVWGAARSVEAWQAATDAHPSMATLDEADAAQRSDLERARRLLADGQVDEAVETVRRLMDADTGRLTAIGDSAESAIGCDRWTTVRSACQMLIGEWATAHPEALALYRRRVDDLAQRWYARAVEQRDGLLLDRLVDQLFMSSYGDDALLVAGDRALERGDYAAARAAWQKIAPALRTPVVRAAGWRTPPGRPWWIGLAGSTFLEASADWRTLVAAPPDRSGRLVYPDSGLPPADLVARLTLASILEGSWRRAEIELTWLRRAHPEATGRLAGREGRWAELLEEQLERSRSEAAAAASADAWGGARRLGDPIWHWPDSTDDADIAAGGDAGRRPWEESSAATAAGGRLVFVRGDRLVALDAKTGRAAFGGAAAAGSDLAGDGERAAREGEFFRLTASGADVEPSGVVSGRLPGWATAQGDRVYAILGGGSFRRSERGAVEEAPAALIAVDMGAEGKTLMRVELRGPDWEGAWQWGGAPTADESSVYACVQRSDGVRAELHAAAFHATSGRLRWRQLVAASEVRGRAEIPAAWLTRVGDRLYCNSNCGAIACLQATDGRLRWATRYRRAAAGDEEYSAGSRLRPVHALNPIVVDGDQLFAAPLDSRRLFSLDADTGQVLWATDEERASGASYLLGVVDGRLIASGERLYWFDAASGASRGEFPAGPASDSPGVVRPGPRGAGRGAAIGGEIWWPARDRLYVFSARTVRSGAVWQPSSGRAYDLRGAGSTGGDLAVVGDVLTVRGVRGLQAFALEPPSTPPLPAQSESATLGPDFAPKTP